MTTSYINKPVYQHYHLEGAAQPIKIMSSEMSTHSSASSSLSSSPKSLESQHHQAATTNQNYYLLATLKHRLMAAAAAAAHIESAEKRGIATSNPAQPAALDSSSSCGEETESMMMEGSGSSSHSSNGSAASTRANRFFPDQVVEILNRWFVDNADYPYPDEHMTNVLAKEANISAKQVRKWFANKRVRSNKCFKQTFKAKKDSSSTNRTRFHAKSMSEMCESPSKLGSSTTDNEEVVVASSLPSVSSIYAVNSHLPALSTSMSTTSSSSSESSSTSSPTHRRSSICVVDHLVSSSSPAMINPAPMQPPSTQSDLLSHHRHSEPSFAATAAAAAFYNPFLFMNLLQSQLKARLNDSNVSATPQSAFNLPATQQFTVESPLIKRKTHLSNCFMQEMSQKELSSSSSSLINRSSSSDTEYDEMQMSQSASPSSSTSVSYLNDTTNNSISPSVPISYQNWQQQVELQHRIKSSQQCCSRLQQENFNNTPLTATARKTKINFGDISDLIN